MGIKDTARGNLDMMKSDNKTLRALAEGISQGHGGQGSILFNLAGEGKGSKKKGSNRLSQ